MGCIADGSGQPRIIDKRLHKGNYLVLDCDVATLRKQTARAEEECKLTVQDPVWFASVGSNAGSES